MTQKERGDLKVMKIDLFVGIIKNKKKMRQEAVFFIIKLIMLDQLKVMLDQLKVMSLRVVKKH